MKHKTKKKSASHENSHSKKGYTTQNHAFNMVAHYTLSWDKTDAQLMAKHYNIVQTQTYEDGSPDFIYYGRRTFCE